MYIHVTISHVSVQNKKRTIEKVHILLLFGFSVDLYFNDNNHKLTTFLLSTETSIAYIPRTTVFYQNV
jgi:hypothetical protein